MSSTHSSSHRLQRKNSDYEEARQGLHDVCHAGFKTKSLEHDIQELRACSYKFSLIRLFSAEEAAKSPEQDSEHHASCTQLQILHHSIAAATFAGDVQANSPFVTI